MAEENEGISGALSLTIYEMTKLHHIVWGGKRKKQK